MRKHSVGPRIRGFFTWHPLRWLAHGLVNKNRSTKKRKNKKTERRRRRWSNVLLDFAFRVMIVLLRKEGGGKKLLDYRSSLRKYGAWRSVGKKMVDSTTVLRVQRSSYCTYVQLWRNSLITFSNFITSGILAFVSLSLSSKNDIIDV